MPSADLCGLLHQRLQFLRLPEAQVDAPGNLSIFLQTVVVSELDGGGMVKMDPESRADLSAPS